MDFQLETVIPRSTKEVWDVLTDIPRVAKCIPGAENIVEKERLSSYSAVLKQQLGPFRLNVPAEIVVTELVESKLLKANAEGRDKTTGTQIKMVLSVALESNSTQSSRLIISSQMEVAGRLATLGYPVIKRKADENFNEFQRRLLEELGPEAPDEPEVVEASPSVFARFMSWLRSILGGK